MRTLTVVPRPERRSRSDRLAASSRGERRGFQIGPKIRIGGTIGKIGQDIKEGAGKVLSNPLVDTALAFVPGVGPGLAAGARGLGTALDTSNGSVGLGDILKNTAEQYGIGKVATSLPGLVKSGASGIAKAGASVLGIGGSSGSSGGTVPGGTWYDPETGEQVPAGTPGAIESPDDYVQPSSGFLDDIKKAITSGGDVLGAINKATGGGSLIDKGLLAAAVADAAATKQRQESLQDKGLSYATDAYDAMKPLRQQGLSMLQQQTAPDLSFVANAQNPYTRSPNIAPLSGKTPILPTGGTYA
jgi:hypothetical protein